MDAGLDLQMQMRTARRSVALLAGAQAILGSIAPLSISLGSLAGYQLLAEDKSLATAPITGFNVGTACGAVAIAIASRWLGRKQAFMLGSVIGVLGGAVAAIALLRGDFWLFVAALILIGTCAGFTQKIRFAAADASPSSYKPKAISWILGAGVVSAVLGPQIAIWAKDLLAPVTFAGAFLAIIPLCIVAFGILTFLKLPKPSTSSAHAQPARPLGEIVLTQRFMIGMICGICTYALMTFVMTGAPLAMVIGCGFPTEMATLGIQWHVLAMFGPSFFTGMLITRFSAEKVVAAGLVILMACAVVAHMGVELWNFWLSLVLLGVGWNFGFIGSTAIVASSYRPHEADKVQGFHDIVLFGTVALSSFSSGKIFIAYGWSFINLVIWPVTIVCLILVLLLIRRGPAKAI
ncbi:MFS transporter [Rhizobium sp. LC145]|jgi:MFS family permease|uniref:MFS transporter n=1 Tax=Rhizobium sp. LC145 TaxID=1120688 RepID=UPI000629EF9B|nr:MFS transporter [Rhizobium sp. LC145]KKX34324.1 MFS transporter [Rhizobium sp. LC145]TKT65544.1 MFS transporter [Rhizobiaceae bacterium LC148]